MFSVRITQLVQDISAMLLPETLAKRLTAQPGSAAIIVRRSYRTADGLVALITVETYPATRFCYTATLERAAPTR